MNIILQGVITFIFICSLSFLLISKGIGADTWQFWFANITLLIFGLINYIEGLSKGEEIWRS